MQQRKLKRFPKILGLQLPSVVIVSDSGNETVRWHYW